MYSELIYTRCRQGIDILKDGRPITSDGYKVYACSSTLLKGENIDLLFLLNAAQAKLPYNEPNFMDDAYLYFVPEKGESFMMNFYPVPFDPNAKGDYAHRAGNFVNHILVGDFSGFYPFELFRDDSVWNAKACGEAYYYENQPTDLPQRNDVGDPAGQFGIEEIGAFISDGREEALKTAVSFLISQYELPPEDRKYLLIKDESTRNIELWIAAIEHAFSPRISASVPFATRMDKFATANRYTVNQVGFYQTQINLQDMNQKLRYRAMLVGVDERDRANTGAARPLANSSFVLLDGKEKKKLFNADTTNRYFNFITRFDHSHQFFCREFLQMIDIRTPSSNIFKLFSVYEIFEKPSLPAARDMSKVVAFLSKYTVFNSICLQQIYARVTAELPRFLQEDLNSAMQIIKWLQTVSLVADDVNASARLTHIICETFSEQMYTKSDPEGTYDFWQNIKNSEYAASVAQYFIDPSTTQHNQNLLQQMTPENVTVYVLIYIDCTTFTDTYSASYLKDVVSWGLETCFRSKNNESARKILKTLSGNTSIDINNLLLSIAGTTERGYAEYIIMLLVEYDESIVLSETTMMTFLKKLSAKRMENLHGAVLKFRSNVLVRSTEIVQMIRLLDKLPALSEIDRAEIFKLLDKKISLTEKSSVNIAKAIQDAMPKGATCKNSAHILALDALGDRRKRQQFTDIYNELIPQGFPSIANDDYIKSLTNALVKAKIESKELYYLIKLFSRHPAYISELVSVILAMTTTKKTDSWNILIFTAAKTQNPILNDVIVTECAKLKQGEKALARLSDTLTKRETRDYFQHIAQKSREVIRLQKPQSVFGRLFGGYFSGNDDSDLKRR